MALTYGVHSEAGLLRRVMVHRPGSEMARLTPENREELLFDDVIDIERAGKQNDSDQRQAERQLIRNHLRCRPQRP